MPYFLNNHFKGNEFELMAKDKYFVDKTEMIEKLNNIIGIKDRFVCITRPRRFGKTVNAMMLACYYSKGANFKNLFDKLEIGKSTSYDKHLNKHNVIYVTFNKPTVKYSNYDEYINSFRLQVIKDLQETFSNVSINVNETLGKIFDDIYNETNEGFIFVIDEWDYIFNNNKTDLFSENDKKDFLQFLEDLLKDKSYVELTYMTGILPIAKYSQSSTINMFKEYNILGDEVYDKYFGFTFQEVRNLCKKQKKVKFNKLKEWYNGYKTCSGLKIFNPRSVVSALSDGICKNYWTNTGPMQEIIYYINNNIDDVKNDILKLVSGIPLKMKLKGYSAEEKNLNTKNQILSAMTIYGFLSYYKKTVEIPNKELRIKFDEALEDKSMGKISELVMKSNQMLKATINKDTKTMEKLVQEAHNLNVPLIQYNDENSLACIITLVYLSAREDYTIKREDPTGIGYADFMFYPNNKSDPAFVIELKKNSTPDEALEQIKIKKYANNLKSYRGKKLAVGIVYYTEDKSHKVKVVDIDDSYYI